MIGESLSRCGCYRWTDWTVIRSVRIDVDALLLEREREREEAEFMAAQTKSTTPPEQSAGPSNPRKRKAADIDTLIDSISTTASKPKSKSRKIKVKEEGTDSAAATASTASSSSSSLKSPMKITLRLAALRVSLLLLFKRNSSHSRAAFVYHAPWTIFFQYKTPLWSGQACLSKRSQRTMLANLSGERTNPAR